ncbi:hypothetical protein E8E13_000627 [Curvularia kusanoi]|uniref:RING-type domain-containing protein n=1 Tax=Curvularia kusanoi TaxID=90978 RepID=A0A9P4T2U4_CURKU|nr:hypothetical protein E8E13_000627 [Curvularia kusanoi]
MDPTQAPVQAEDWVSQLKICRTRLRRLHLGNHPILVDPSPFYIPRCLKWLVNKHEPGEDLLKFITLVRDLYLSQICEPDVILGSSLSDLKSEAEIGLALTNHVHRIMPTRRSGKATHTLASQIVAVLKEELKKLQESGMTPVPECRGSAQTCRVVCELYFLACATHPDIDLWGENTIYYTSLFHEQPCYGDEDGETNHSLPENIATLLLRLFQTGLVTKADDITPIFETIGRWMLTATVDILGSDSPIDYEEGEDVFLDYYADDLSNPASPTPSSLRREICNINLRHVYRELCWSVADILREDEDLTNFDVLNHRMWKCMIRSILDSDLEPRQKNFVSVWLWRSGYVRAYSSQEPIGAPWPGQRVFSNLNPEANTFERLMEPVPERAEDLQDVEFQAAGSDLEALNYSTKLENPTDYDEAECIICLEDLTDDQQLKVKINVCGHLSHGHCLCQLINGMDQWSNKCPLCRREICPPRQREPVIDAPTPAPSHQTHELLRGLEAELSELAEAVRSGFYLSQ